MLRPTKTFTCSAILQNDNPILRDHRVHGVRIMPGVVFLDMVFRALRDRGFDIADVELRDILFIEPIATTERFDRKVSLSFTPHDAQGLRWQVTATRPYGPWSGTGCCARTGRGRTACAPGTTSSRPGWARTPG